MKVIEKITLIIYSNIILILSIIACLLIFGWLDIDIVQGLVRSLLLYGTSSKVILGVSIVFILLSLRCIFFDPTSKQELKDRNLAEKVEKDRLKEIDEHVKEYEQNKDLQNQFDYVFINDYTEKSKNDLLKIIKERIDR